MVVLYVHNFMFERLKGYGTYMCWKSMHTLQAFANIQVHLFTACRRWITWHCFPIVSDIKCDASRPCTSDSVAYFVYDFSQNKTPLQYKSTNLQTIVLSPSFVFWTNNILFEQPFTDVLRMSCARHLDMNVIARATDRNAGVLSWYPADLYGCWGVISTVMRIWHEACARRVVS